MLRHKEKIEKQTGNKIEVPSLETSYDVWLMELFKTLHMHRNAGTPITLSDIYALFQIENVPQYDRNRARKFVSYLDGTYLDWHHKEEKRKAKKRK